jgi:hypothetical protein
MRLAQAIDSGTSQSASLVESALAVLAAMERHGNHEHLGRSFRQELCDRFGEHRSETVGGWMHAIVLERMNRCAHATLVSAERNSSYERRRGQAAGPAEL